LDKSRETFAEDKNDYGNKDKKGDRSTDENCPPGESVY
jgi:hypothetical protein